MRCNFDAQNCIKMINLIQVLTVGVCRFLSWRRSPQGGDVAHKGGDAGHKGGDIAHKGGDVAHKGGDVAHKGGDVAHKGGDVAHKQCVVML